MPVTSFSWNALHKVMPSGKRQKLIIQWGLLWTVKKWLLTFLASWLRPNVKKINFINTIVSFKDMFDTVLCKMYSKYDAISCWFFRLSRLPGLGAVCRWNCQQVQCMLLFKQIVDGLYLPVCSLHITTVDSVQQFVLTSSAKHVMLNSL